jgi:hypothetical protein
MYRGLGAPAPIGPVVSPGCDTMWGIPSDAYPISPAETVGLNTKYQGPITSPQDCGLSIGEGEPYFAPSTGFVYCGLIPGTGMPCANPTGPQVANQTPNPAQPAAVINTTPALSPAGSGCVSGNGVICFGSYPVPEWALLAGGLGLLFAMFGGR